MCLDFIGYGCVVVCEVVGWVVVCEIGFGVG